MLIFLHFVFFQMVTKTKKIFVGGLSAQTTVDDVKKHFLTYGPVSIIEFIESPPLEYY